MHLQNPLTFAVECDLITRMMFHIHMFCTYPRGGFFLIPWGGNLRDHHKKMPPTALFQALVFSSCNKKYNLYLVEIMGLSEIMYIEVLSFIQRN